MNMRETNKYTRMIEAFECDFALSKFNCGYLHLQLPLTDRLKGDIHLLEELSFLLRHNKAKIILLEDE